MKIDKTKSVLVTGANGYVASWLVKKLLENGINVHAAVRNPENDKKINHLKEIAKKNSGNITFFACDLLKEGSYKKAMEGCELIYHTASPFTTNVKNPQTELIQPALIGTENIIKSANQTTSVKRIVLTSSCAAIYTDAKECLSYPNQELKENIWNETASIKHQPYSFSKTLAEKRAWEMAKLQNQWQLVVLNPSLVLGPFLNPKETSSESFNILKQIGDGTFKQGAPNLGIGVVDVRDLATAHYKAGFEPNANGRNIANAHNTNFYEMCLILHEIYGDFYPIPNKKAPKWLIWLIGPILNKGLSRKYVSNNIGYIFKANNSKIKKELNVEFRSLTQTLKDSFDSLVRSEIIVKK